MAKILGWPPCLGNPVPATGRWNLFYLNIKTSVKTLDRVKTFVAGQKEQCNILNFLHVVQVKQFLIPTSQTFKEGFSIDIACYMLFQLEILLIKI